MTFVKAHFRNGKHVKAYNRGGSSSMGGKKGSPGSLKARSLSLKQATVSKNRSGASKEARSTLKHLMAQMKDRHDRPNFSSFASKRELLTNGDSQHGYNVSKKARKGTRIAAQQRAMSFNKSHDAMGRKMSKR